MRPRPDKQSAVEVVNFGCRLNLVEGEAHAPRRAGAGARQSRHRQHLRGDGRGRPPGAPDDPPAEARGAGARDHRHRLRGADRSRSPSPPCRKSPKSSAMGRRRRSRFRRSAKSRASRSATFSRAKRPLCRRVEASRTIPAPFSPSRPAAIIAAPSASFPWPRRLALHADAAVLEAVGRCLAKGFREIVLTGVDLTAYGRDFAGRAQPRPGW